MMKEYQKSIDDNEKYLEIKPNDADIINSIAVGYLNLKEYNKALAASNKCISLDPAKGAFFMNRSAIFNAAGDKKRALDDALIARKLGFRVDDNYISSLRI
jgi:tetratricopeptide (TPR) repeat protein